MTTRRTVLALSSSLFLPALARPARAQSASDRAVAFVRSTGERIVSVMKGPGTPDEKRRILTPIIDNSIDVDGVARFCLGRFWRSASPAQQKRYTELFHQVLITNITSKLGEYQEVNLIIGKARRQDDGDIVATTLERPNNPPTTVEWVVTDSAGNLKVVDVIAEGTSLRLTQRQDYASFLSRNNSDIDALIAAMRSQLTGH